MRQGCFWLRLVMLGMAVAWLAACDRHAASPPAKEAVAKAGEIGSRLPEFAMEDLDGHKLSSTDFRGKVVIVDFWATWCQPCKKEMPGYQSLVDRYSTRGFAVVGFKFDVMPDTEDPVKFAKNIGVHYPLAVAEETLKQKFGGIEGLPTTMIYDRQGILRQKIVGFEYTQVVESGIKGLL